VTRKTETAPESERPAWADPEPVIGFRVAGSSRELALPPVAVVHIGASHDCDVVVDSPHVSALHAILERVNGRLRVRDAGSKNGTYIDGKRVTEGDVSDGSILIIGTTPLVAFSARSARVRRQLQWWLGYGDEQQSRVDDALRLVASDAHVVIVSPKGGEPDKLARAIHEASPRAHGPFVKLEHRGIG